VPPFNGSDVDQDEAGADEGGILLRQHLRRERDVNSVETRSRPYGTVAGSSHGRYVGSTSSVCRVTAAETTSSAATGYRCSALATPGRLCGIWLICSNCHRMIHRTKSWLLPEQLRKIVNDRC
jgi:5-methylcytosine-specific restriction protein A